MVDFTLCLADFAIWSYSQLEETNGEEILLKKLSKTRFLFASFSVTQQNQWFLIHIAQWIYCLPSPLVSKHGYFSNPIKNHEDFRRSPIPYTYLIFTCSRFFYEYLPVKHFWERGPSYNDPNKDFLVLCTIREPLLRPHRLWMLSRLVLLAISKLCID